MLRGKLTSWERHNSEAYYKVSTTREPSGPDQVILADKTDSDNEGGGAPVDRSGLRIALIGFLGTVILAGAGVVGAIIQAHAGPASPAAPLGARSISIDPTKDGAISYPTALEGDVSGLQPGEMVWTFNQPADNPEAVTYPNSGPCVVDYDHKRWKCSHIYIGAPPGRGGYRIWAAVVNERQAFDIVIALRSPRISIQGDEPPHVLNAIASITGRRAG